MDGVRVVMLIDRGVQNSNKGSRRWINKIITTNYGEWIKAVKVLSDMQDYIGNPDIRLYSCVNDRKIDKAILMFKHKQLDVLEESKNTFYAKINDSFASCLMKPENKNTNFFLLDIDTRESKEIDKFVQQYAIQVFHTYPTKKGWHYITLPFNAKIADNQTIFTLQKDGLLLIRYIEDKQ